MFSKKKKKKKSKDFLLTQLISLSPDGTKFFQHFLAENRDLAGVDHINHTVNPVTQSHMLLIARSIC